MNDLAVVVPIYISNEKDIIFETLRNIRNQVDCKIYVPWNGKDGDEKNIIKQISLLATPLYVEKSRSKAENLNAFLDFIPPEIKYIVILDADSRPKEKCISILYHKIKNTPPEIGWIQGNYSVNRGKNRIVVDLDESENRLACKLEKILSSNASFKGHDAIFKREVLEKADGFNPNCLLEDKDLTMRLHKLGFSGQREENYKSSSEACPTWKDFFRQRSRWIQGDMR